jgi:NAD dependent epimerase/dehydratase
VRLEGKRILVTGAGGFIGGHLVEKLIRSGAHVRGLLRYTSEASLGTLEQLPAEVIDDLEIYRGDLRDLDAVRSAMKGSDIVFHLGALIAIPYSYVNPLEYIHVNTNGTAHVAVAARDEKVERLVHVSTSEVYGTAEYVPIDEKHPLKGQSPYSASKIGADQIVNSFVRSFELPAVTVRPFNTYGPRQSARAIIPTVITQVLAGQPPRLGALHPTRDFNYVDDTVRGMILAATASDLHGETVNLSTGREISIGELAQRIIAAVNPDLEIVPDDSRVRPPGSEVDRLCGSAARAEQLLGWKPEVSLSEGLGRTITYLAEHRVADAGTYRT